MQRWAVFVRSRIEDLMVVSRVLTQWQTWLKCLVIHLCSVLNPGCSPTIQVLLYMGVFVGETTVDTFSACILCLLL